MRSHVEAALLFLILIAVFASSGESVAGDASVPGSVTFAFDGGSLQCTFGTKSRNAISHTALILHPSSVEAFKRRTGTKIDGERMSAIVLVPGEHGKLVQLDGDSAIVWSKSRIAQMSGRRTSVAENSFVAAVVHALTNRLTLSLWGADAQQALETGSWCKLFDEKANRPIDGSEGDPFDGDPFSNTQPRRVLR